MKNKVSSLYCIVLITLFTTVIAICSCMGGNRDHLINSSTPTITPSNVIPLQASAGYLSRKAQYLAYCSANSGPGSGQLYGQVCRAYTREGPFDEVVIQKSRTKIAKREDCSDFDLNAIVRMLYIDRQNPVLPDALRNDMKTTVLNFKYWLDEPGSDDMVWWSENHQVLFHTVELLAGLLYPDEVFPNSGMTGREHAEHARPMLKKWLDYRARFGFSEWHSNVYFNEDIPPIVNLIDYADEESVRIKATMLLDVMFFDMGSNFYKGLFATTHGRTYPDNFIGGLRDSIREPVWIVLGIVDIASINELGVANFSGAFIATSDNYVPPPILEEVANDMKGSVEHKQRDSISIEDGPKYGITYDNFEDVMFWWGMTGYMDPAIINGSFYMIDYYNMWAGNTWKDVSFLKPLVGTKMLEIIATDVEPMAGGATMESINTYTYRTPYYQLSAAQDWKSFVWTGQATIWQATIDKDCNVFSGFPATFPFGGSFGSEWTGGFTPRATFYKNVGILQYHQPVLGTLEAYLGVPIDWSKMIADYTHAYFPKSKFDEYVETPNWFFGRKGDAYMALGSYMPPVWKTADPNEYDLIAYNTDNVWLVEMGDVIHNGSFTEFVNSILTAVVSVGATVYFESPSLGPIEVGWTGPMKVKGTPVDLGPYARWDNPYAHQEFGTTTTTISFGGKILILNFATPQRLYIRQ